MSKSSSGGLFGGPRTGSVTIVETPLAQTYARKARLTFYIVALVVALVVTVALSHRFIPLAGLVLGTLVGIVAGLVAALLVRAWPVLRALWHWSVEIGLLFTVVLGWPALVAATNTVVCLLIVSILVGVPAAVGPIRRRVIAVVWCAIWRHRLRLCFAQIIRTGVRSRAGHPPLILTARPTPAGGRVWVWLRPGLELADLEGQTGKLAVACWADQVRVARAGRSYAALVRVDIARRDPLRATIASPLPDLLPDFDPAVVAPTSPGMPPLALDLPDVPDPDESAWKRPTSPRSPRSPRKSRAADTDAGPDAAGEFDAYI
jgi:hypothetical protein